MILFLHGEDSFRVNRRRRELQQAFVKKYPQAEVFVFDFEDQRTSQDVQRAFALAEQGLFATEKLLVFLHPMSLQGEGETLLLEFLKAVKKDSASPATMLFVEPGKTKKTQPIAKFLLKEADKVEVFEKMSEAEAASYVRKELSTLDPKMSFSREALGIFLQVTGGESARIRSELEKLSSFKPGERIEPEDVRLFSDLPSQTTIFDALDCLGRGERGAALRLLASEASRPEGIFPVLSMCAWYIRTMLLVREAYEGGIRRANEVAVKTKLSPFVVRKALPRIGDFPLPRLKQGLTLLAELDTALKSSSLETETALDLFVWRF